MLGENLWIGKTYCALAPGAVEPALRRGLCLAPRGDEGHATPGGPEQERELLLDGHEALPGQRRGGLDSSRMRARTSSTRVRTPTPVPPLPT